MRALVFVAAVLLIFLSSVCSELNEERAKDPWKEPGLVPDKETAIKIAEAVVFPIYGEEDIKKERPYSVTLENGFWRVVGTMSEGLAGGTFYVVISHWDGRIVAVGHTL